MKRNIFQVITLLLFLVALPAVSWVYLSKGLNYRKATIAELKDLGKIPAFPYLMMDGDTLDETALGGKVLVAHQFAGYEEAQIDRVCSELGKIHEQFNERPDVMFLMLGRSGDSAVLNNLLERYKLQDPGQVFAVVTPGSADGDFGLSGQGNGASTTVALSDSSGTIRQYYDFKDGNRVRRLVEHIAMLMPFRERDQAVLKREKEK